MKLPFKLSPLPLMVTVGVMLASVASEATERLTLSPTCLKCQAKPKLCKDKKVFEKCLRACKSADKMKECQTVYYDTIQVTSPSHINQFHKVTPNQSSWGTILSRTDCASIEKLIKENNYNNEEISYLRKECTPARPKAPAPALPSKTETAQGEATASSTDVPLALPQSPARPKASGPALSSKAGKVYPERPTEAPPLPPSDAAVPPPPPPPPGMVPPPPPPPAMGGKVASSGETALERAKRLRAERAAQEQNGASSSNTGGDMMAELQAKMAKRRKDIEGN